MKIPRKAFQYFGVEWNSDPRNKKNKVDLLTDNELDLMQEIVDVLEPLLDATTQISGQSYTTLSLVIPIATNLFNIYANEPNDGLCETTIFFKEKIMDSIKTRFGNFNTNKAYVCATILDPNHKQVAFGDDPDLLYNAIQIVKEEAYNTIPEELKNSTVSDLSQEEETSSPKDKGKQKPISKLWKDYDLKKKKQAKKVSNVLNLRKKLDEQLEEYLEIPAFDRENEVDPIVW